MKQSDTERLPSGAEIRAFREALRVVERELGLSLDRETSCCGVTLAQCHLLLACDAAPSSSLSDLAASLALDKSTMSRTVDALHNAHYLQRAEDPENRRKVSIQLTEEGREKIDSIHSLCDASWRDLFRLIPPEKHALILEALPILAAALTAKRQSEKGGPCCGGSR